MNNRITRFFQGLTLTTFSMAVYNTINGIKNKENMVSYKETLESMSFDIKLHNTNQVLFQRKIEQKLEVISSQAQNNSNIQQNISDAVEKATQPLMSQVEGYATLSKNINEPGKLNPEELVKAISDFKTTGKSLEEGQRSALSKLDKILEEISNGGGGGTGSQSQYIQDISNFLNSLTFEQTVAIVNITGCVAILISLLSLFIIFYGNILIDTLQLEKRLPRIARFIQWRRKFQMYYSLIDFIIIMSVSSIMIYINLLIYGS